MLVRNVCKADDFTAACGFYYRTKVKNIGYLGTDALTPQDYAFAATLVVLIVTTITLLCLMVAHVHNAYYCYNGIDVVPQTLP
jgi:hypothetical protein